MKATTLFAAIFGVLILAACSSGAEDGTTVDFRITDAPVAGDSIAAVYVTFSSLQINESTSAGDQGSGWKSVPIDTTKEYELLSLTGGLSEALGDIDLTGGSRVNQISFGISKIELVETGDTPGAPRHEVTLSSNTGLKIVNSFQVPRSGNVTIVVDFDVRKSLVNAGGSYKMKPVLRAIVENEAGTIKGTAPAGYLVFAYPADRDRDLSFTDPADDADSTEYDNAYTSVKVGDDGSYTLAFMDPLSYDLILVNGADGMVAQVVSDVAVESDKTTIQNILLP